MALDEVRENMDKLSVYELGYHLVPTIGDEHVAQEVAALKQFIEKNGGVFVMEEYPTLTPLSYTLEKLESGKRQKYSTAYFGWVKFELASRVLGELKESLDHHEALLRYLLVKTVKEDTRAPKRVFQRPEAAARVSQAGKTGTEPKAEISEEALDRSLADLVVE